MSKTKKLTKETFNPKAFTFIDLGLPSGKLWATENAPGHYTFDEAVDTFGELLPKASAMMELTEECKCTWNKKNKGLDITGPNGNSIFLPATGFTLDSSTFKLKREGNYWTRMPCSQNLAIHLGFDTGGMDPLNDSSRCLGYSVRLCRELR